MVPHSRVHCRLRVGHLGAACLRLERQTKSEKVAGPDLTTATAKHDKAFLEKYLTKQETLDGKKHGKEWKGTPQELDAVIDWLKQAKK